MPSDKLNMDNIEQDQTSSGNLSPAESVNIVKEDSLNKQICEKTKERTYLENLLNKTLKIEISDGRTLIGSFLCTDKDRNVVLGSCQEFVGDPGSSDTEEPRILGLAMVPGKHIVSMHVDTNAPIVPPIGQIPNLIHQ